MGLLHMGNLNIKKEHNNNKEKNHNMSTHKTDEK